MASYFSQNFLIAKNQPVNADVADAGDVDERLSAVDSLALLEFDERSLFASDDLSHFPLLVA